MESFFKISNSFSNFWPKNENFQTNSEAIAGLCFYPKCFMFYINGFISTSSTNLWKVFFFKFQIRFWIFGQKTKNFQTNSKAWVLIKLQCVIYQWIRFDKLYKLMESFLHISNLFLNYCPKTEKYSMHNKVGFMQTRWVRHLCWSAPILVYNCSSYDKWKRDTLLTILCYMVLPIMKVLLVVGSMGKGEA